MGKGKSKDNWNHTSAIIAKVHNVNCTKKKDLIKPEEINPHIVAAGENTVIVKTAADRQRMKNEFEGTK